MEKTYTTEASRLMKLALEFTETRIKHIRQMMEKDMEAGKRDAMAGIFDKWYRENRADEGLAYRAGWEVGKNEAIEAGVYDKIQII